MGLSENRVPQTPRVNGVSPIRASCRFEALTGSLWARSKQCLGRGSRGVDPRNLAWPFRVDPINPQQRSWQLKLLQLPGVCFFRSHCDDSAQFARVLFNFHLLGLKDRQCHLLSRQEIDLSKKQ